MISQSTFSFPAVVNGVKLTATVLAQESDERDFHYRVLFSDGYQDVFFNDEQEQLVGVLGKPSDAYAEAIAFDVHHYLDFDPEKFWYVFPEEIEGKLFNVWIFEEESEDEEENIEIYYNVFLSNMYRFHFLKLGGSWLLANRNNEELYGIDHQLAPKVKDLLIALL